MPAPDPFRKTPAKPGEYKLKPLPRARRIEDRDRSKPQSAITDKAVSLDFPVAAMRHGEGFYPEEHARNLEAFTKYLFSKAARPRQPLASSTKWEFEEPPRHGFAAQAPGGVDIQRTPRGVKPGYQEARPEKQQIKGG